MVDKHGNEREEPQNVEFWLIEPPADVPERLFISYI
jgi:hypothetical protein